MSDQPRAIIPSDPPTDQQDDAATGNRRKGGRPIKLDDAIADRMVEAFTLGSTLNIALSYGGISEMTYRDYLARGRAVRKLLQDDVDEEGRPLTTSARNRLLKDKFFVFLGRIEESQGKAAVTWLKLIEDAGKVDWRAAAWKLERRYPQDYGRTVTEVQVNDKPLEDEATRMAKMLGIDPSALLAEAQAIANEDASAAPATGTGV